MAGKVAVLSDGNERRLLAVMIAGVLGWQSCSVGLAADEVASPLSPEDSLKHFVLADPDLTIEIAAAEPQVVDPVAMRFDEHGRMWVVEMRDYPTGPKNGGEPQSRIVVLDDEDKDGRYEKSTVFADKLLFPTGLQPWKGGVIVTLSGRVAWMKDTDNDGRADVDETWYTGFAEENTQLRANHPRLGLDGWIYVANGLKGGRIQNHRVKGSPEVVINGMDVRFHPHTGDCEAITGNGQFGMTFDDFGHRFVCTNRNPLEHVVFENWQLARFPNVPVPKVMHSVAAAAEQSRIYPLSRAWTTSNLHANQFTAACGCLIYRSFGLTKAYQPQYEPLQYSTFVCDPTANLVHWEVMTRNLATFTSKPGVEDKEFLASPDEWFRPVNLEEGPDGALYVVDMHRAVIEHPDFVPTELKKRPDERLGDDRGRIYRIVPKGTEYQPERYLSTYFKTSKKDPKDRAGFLRSIGAQTTRSSWARDTIARLMWEDEALRLAAVPGLAECLEDRFAPALLAQYRELIRPSGGPKHTRSLSEDWGQAALQTEQGVRRLNEELAPATAAEGTSFPSQDWAGLKPEVRFQSLLLPRTKLSEDDAAALVTIAEKRGNDAWFRTALLMASAKEPDDFLLQLLRSEKAFPIPLLVQIAERAGERSDNDTARAIYYLLSQRLPRERAATFATLAAFSEGLTKKNQTLEQVGSKADRWYVVLDGALDSSFFAKDLEERLAAVRFLQFTPRGNKDLSELFERANPVEVQVAVVAALGRSATDDEWSKVLDTVIKSSPVVRQVILDHTLRQAGRITLLLDQLEKGQIKAAELDVVMTNRLKSVKDPAQRERANKLLAAAVPADRTEALEKYQPALARDGDALQGKITFEKNCATCHRIGDVGVNVAPDISDSRTKTTAQLLTDIVQPNRAIDANYVAYVVTLQDGTTASGVLSAETSTSITLRQPGDKTLVVLRSDIDELKSLGVSLMPEGLEKNIPVESMSDLLSYIKNWRYLDGKTPLSPK